MPHVSLFYRRFDKDYIIHVTGGVAKFLTRDFKIYDHKFDHRGRRPMESQIIKSTLG